MYHTAPYTTRNTCTRCAMYHVIHKHTPDNGRAKQPYIDKSYTACSSANCSTQLLRLGQALAK